MAGELRAGPPRRAVLLVNPGARRGDEALDPVIAALRAGAVEIVEETMAGPEEVERCLLGHAETADCAIVCGGDGSLSMAVPGLLASGLTLGILPMGTANDLARTLDIPMDLLQAADVILAGNTRKIDLGSVNGHAFFNVASIGLSADLAQGLQPELKKRFGRFGYALAAARVLLKAQPFTATIREKGLVTKVKTFQIAVGNGRHYGGGNVIEVSAEIDDGHLDLYSLELGTVWKLAGMLRSFRAGTHGAWDEVRTARCVEFDIETRRVFYAENHVVEIDQQRDAETLQALHWFQVASILIVLCGSRAEKRRSSNAHPNRA